MKEICGKCKGMASGKIAVWMYIPDDEVEIRFYCDDCVPRGCFCQMDVEDSVDSTEEGTDWEEQRQMIRNGTHPLISTHARDEEGRLLPCVEFEYSEDGFEEGISGAEVLEKMFQEAKAQGRVIYESPADDDEIE
jgi:hypothetical protein